MSQILIKHGTVVLADRLISNHAVLCRNGKIEKIAPTPELETTPVDQVIDAKGLYLAPGYIDLHLHGTHQYLIDHGAKDLSALCRLLPQYGLTGFLPGVLPLPKGEDAEFLSSLAKTQYTGTQILGFHLEGPFISIPGAIPKDTLSKNDPDRVKSLIKAAKPYSAVFSISPELEGISDLIPIMKQNNTPVFITHTRADVKQTQAAIETGARHATHFYDVFPVPPETEPGVRTCGTVETILSDPRVSVDFILDGVHVDPIAVKMALACKGPDRVCLITDANIGAGLPPGRFKFQPDVEVEFAYKGAPARMSANTPHPGGLAGSGLTLDQAVRNAIEMLGVDLPQAVRMASTNPARVLGLDHSKGQIKAGFDADMILLNESLHVVQTWIGGICSFSVP